MIYNTEYVAPQLSEYERLRYRILAEDSLRLLRKEIPACAAMVRNQIRIGLQRGFGRQLVQVWLERFRETTDDFIRRTQNAIEMSDPVDAMILKIELDGVRATFGSFTATVETLITLEPSPEEVFSIDDRLIDRRKIC